MRKEEKRLMNKINKLKKEFWTKYTPSINEDYDAFELMRKIGVEQGRLTQIKEETKQ